MTPDPKRRWFSFSLRTMFVVVTLFGCSLGYQLNWIRERYNFLVLQENAMNAPEIYLNPGKNAAPSLLGLFGEPGYDVVEVWVDGAEVAQITTQDKRRVHEAKRLFPEAQIMMTHKQSEETGRSKMWAAPAP